MLTITLPDTPETRKILEQLAGHTADDIAEGFYGEDGDEPDPSLYAANTAVVDALNATLHPDA